jgi:hypothetical protein
MTVYWFKYRGKPTGKVFVHTSSNLAKLKTDRQRLKKAGFKCNQISWTDSIASIYGGRVK